MNDRFMTLARSTRHLLAFGLAASTACVQNAPVDVAQTPAAQTIAAVSGTLLELPDGPIQGEADGHTRSFIGIPYAAPPVGALRWQPPQPVARWSETLDAAGPGVSCVQAPGSTLQTEPQSEDCLQLNVFAPAEPPAESLPVMVWLHGGGNSAGSANQFIDRPAIPGTISRHTRIYDGAKFRAYAEREVVVVTINYRLGALGFLSHPALTAEHGASGNYGLMDQQAALRWVQRNIAAFGGDPSRVTLFGQEAGAVDSCYQLFASGAQGLFDAAVLQSGSCGSVRLPELCEAEARGESTAAALGCESLACLRALPAQQLAAAAGELGASESALAVIDGKYLSEQPEHALRLGHFEQLPLIIGNDAQETEQSCPARELALRVTRFAPVYLYSFSRSAAFDAKLFSPVAGADELWVWDVWSALTPYAADDTSLSLQMRGYWMQLVDGNVNVEEPRWPRPEWPRFEPTRESELVLDLHIGTADGLRSAGCQR